MPTPLCKTRLGDLIRTAAHLWVLRQPRSMCWMAAWGAGWTNLSQQLLSNRKPCAVGPRLKKQPRGSRTKGTTWPVLLGGASQNPCVRAQEVEGVRTESSRLKIPVLSTFMPGEDSFTRKLLNPKESQAKMEAEVPEGLAKLLC